MNYRGTQNEILFFFDTPHYAKTDAPVIAVRPGEMGYLVIHSEWSAETLNAGRFTPEQLRSALHASMFGWGTPVARPALELARALSRGDA